MTRSLPAVVISGCLLGLLGSTPALAQDAGDAVERTEQQRESDAASQRRIDRLDDTEREALQAYRAAVWETQQLNVYREQLQELIDRQADKLSSLENQLEELARTERDIMPLMKRMVDALERFIAMDMPFLQDERQRRVADLRDAMTDPGVSVADRYQAIMEAYAAETDYGRGIGHERSEIDGQVHDLIRIGRVALYALALDGSEAKRWDAATEQWQPLAGHYIPALRKAMRISREVVAPELMMLPVGAPGSRQASPAAPELGAVPEGADDEDAEADAATDEEGEQ
jgi:hypothetical protein